VATRLPLPSNANTTRCHPRHRRFDSGPRPAGKKMTSPKSLKKLPLPCKDNAPTLPSRRPMSPATYHPRGGIGRFDSLARSADKIWSPKYVMTPPISSRHLLEMPTGTSVKTESLLPADGRPRISPPSAEVAGPLPLIRMISTTFLSERKTKALLPPSQPVPLVSSYDDSDFQPPTVEPSSPIFHILSRPPPLLSAGRPNIEQDVLIAAPRRSKSPAFIRKRTFSPNLQIPTSNTKPTKEGASLARPIPPSRFTSPASTKTTKHRDLLIPPIRFQSPGPVNKDWKCPESSFGNLLLPPFRFQCPVPPQKAPPFLPSAS
jgi:hypothetical protein